MKKFLIVLMMSFSAMALADSKEPRYENLDCISKVGSKLKFHIVEGNYIASAYVKGYAKPILIPRVSKGVFKLQQSTTIFKVNVSQDNRGEILAIVDKGDTLWDDAHYTRHYNCR